MDFSVQLRQIMIDTLQASLKSVRQALGFGVQQFADVIGLTRQSVNNLESGKIRMSAMQFLAICAVMDYFVEAQPNLLPVLVSILNVHNPRHAFEYVEDGSFVKKWLLSFPVISKEILHDTDMLSQLAEEYKIFLDDTAVCELHMELQTADLIERMRRKDAKLIVPSLALESLQKQAQSKEQASRDRAWNGLSALRKLYERGLVQFRGEKNDVNLVTTLMSVFIRFKMHYRIALITQNEKLAESILLLNDDEKLNGFEILAFRFCSDGMLQDWRTFFEEQKRTINIDAWGLENNLWNDQDVLSKPKTPDGWSML